VCHLSETEKIMLQRVPILGSIFVSNPTHLTSLVSLVCYIFINTCGGQ